MSILSDELSKPEYANLSDQAAADAINAKTVTATQLVPIWQVKEHAILNGYWPLVKAGQLDSDLSKAGLCVSVIDWIDDPKMQSIDVNKAEVQGMLSGLVAFQLMSQQEANELIAMGSKSIAWTISVGLPEVGIGLVINARKEIGVNN
jgi:hypothetical protein